MKSITVFLITLLLAAQISVAQQITPPPDASRSRLFSIIDKLNTRVGSLAKQNAGLKDQVEGLQQQVSDLLNPKPVIVGIPPTVLSWYDGQYVEVHAGEVLDNVGAIDVIKAVKLFLAMPATARYCVFDIEGPWLETQEGCVAHNPQRNYLIKIARGIRPDVLYSFYGIPVTTCDAGVPDSNDAKWHAIDWAGVTTEFDFICPSVYQAKAGADPACCGLSVTYALEVAKGRPVLPYTAHRLMDINHGVYNLIAQDEYKKHIESIFSVKVGDDVADGLVFWNADRLGFSALVAPQVPQGIEFDVWCDWVDTAYKRIALNVVKGESTPIPAPPVPVVGPPTPPTTQPGMAEKIQAFYTWAGWTVAPPQGNIVEIPVSNDFGVRTGGVTDGALVGPRTIPSTSNRGVLQEGSPCKRISIKDLTAVSMPDTVIWFAAGEDVIIINGKFSQKSLVNQTLARHHGVKRLLYVNCSFDNSLAQNSLLRVADGAVVGFLECSFTGRDMSVGWTPDANQPNGWTKGGTSNGLEEAWFDNCSFEFKYTAGPAYPKMFSVYPSPKAVRFRGAKKVKAGQIVPFTLADMSVWSQVPASVVKFE